MPVSFFSKHHFAHYLASVDHASLKEHTAIYLTNTIRRFAVALVGIFLPIYIFNLSSDYMWFTSNTTTNGIVWVLVYYSLRSIFVLLSLTLFSNFMFNKLHLNRSLCLGLVFLAIEMVMWVLAEGDLRFILLAGAIGGLECAFYWVAYHIFFVRRFDDASGKYGSKLGWRLFLSRIASAITPAAGGLIIVTFGFKVLFLLSVALVLIAGLPMLFAVYENKHSRHSVGDAARLYLLNPEFKKVTLGFFGTSMDSIIYTVLWPIMLFVVIRDFVDIGLLNSLSFLVSLVVVLLVSRKLDKEPAKNMHAVGVVINALLYIPRIFLKLPIIAYSIEILDRLNSSLYSIPRMSLVYEKARRHSCSDFFIYRELVLHGGRLFIVVPIILLFVSGFTAWTWLFVLAAVGSLMTFFIDLDDN